MKLGVCAAALVMAILYGSPGRAEPAPTWLYADPANGTCGELWGGDEWVVRLPASPTCVRADQLPFKDSAFCSRVLGIVGMARPLDLPDAGADACRILRHVLNNRYGASAEKVCQALGYQFVKEIPFATQPGPATRFRDDAPGPRWGTRLAVAVVAVLVIGAVVLVRRRASRRA